MGKKKWMPELTTEYSNDIDALIGTMEDFREKWSKAAKTHRRPLGEDAGIITDREMDLQDYLDKFMQGDD